MSIEQTNSEHIVGTLSKNEQHVAGELHSADSHLSGRVSVGGSATVSMDYNRLKNKPMIEGVVLEGDKTFEELHLNVLTNEELEAILV